MAFKYCLIFLNIFCLFVNQTRSVNYCSKKCSNGYKHTICERGCKPVKGCAAYRENQVQFRKTILDAHNKLRNSVATGEEKRKGLKGAANMKALSWDYELEKVAQCWINICEMKHDKCRWTQSHMDVGQNLYSQTESRKKRYIIGSTSQIEMVVKAWYDEIVDVPEDIFGSFRTVSGPPIGHFTQVIWANTLKVGCARSHYGGRKSFFVACNYGPAGNYLSLPIFMPGLGCSQCGVLVCNPIYTGLCGLSTIPPAPPEIYFLSGCLLPTGSKYFVFFVIILFIKL